MPTLEAAEGPLLEQILAATYEIWNEGLTADAYRRWWTAQRATPWGARHLRRTALVDAGRVLASTKEYWFEATLNRRSTKVIGLGAVFTQPDSRGRGFARDLIQRVLERARGEGAELALLFSEIGPAYYEALGFTVVPTADLELRVAEPIDAGAPATLVRGGADGDLEAIAAMDGVRASPFRFHLNRDRALAGYAIAKKRLLAGLGPAGRRELQFVVAEEGASAAAYVVVTVELEEQTLVWTLEECGDRDPSGARIGAILQVLMAREPSRARPRIRGWLPSSFVPPQVTIVGRAASANIMMVRPLGSTRIGPPLDADDVLYWRADVF
jgi:predicted N-acetyltransferase YhbS